MDNSHKKRKANDEPHMDKPDGAVLYKKKNRTCTYCKACNIPIPFKYHKNICIEYEYCEKCQHKEYEKNRLKNSCINCHFWFIEAENLCIHCLEKKYGYDAVIQHLQQSKEKRTQHFAETYKNTHYMIPPKI